MTITVENIPDDVYVGMWKDFAKGVKDINKAEGTNHKLEPSQNITLDWELFISDMMAGLLAALLLQTAFPSTDFKNFQGAKLR